MKPLQHKKAIKDVTALRQDFIKHSVTDARMMHLRHLAHLCACISQRHGAARRRATRLAPDAFQSDTLTQVTASCIALLIPIDIRVQNAGESCPHMSREWCKLRLKQPVHVSTRSSPRFCLPPGKWQAATSPDSSSFPSCANNAPSSHSRRKATTETTRSSPPILFTIRIHFSEAVSPPIFRRLHVDFCQPL
jgi:hypothetical protein